MELTKSFAVNIFQLYHKYSIDYLPEPGPANKFMSY